MSVGIVTDSIACLPQEIVNEYGISVVSPNIFFGDRVYRDGIDLSHAQAYELIEKAPDQFAVSPPSPMEYIQAYRELSSRASSILCITLSSKLSTLYNVARLARDHLKDELEGVPIEIFDSLTAAGAEGLIVLAAARAAAAGGDLQEVISVAKEARIRTGLIGVLETVRYVYRSGRVPKLAAYLGSMLKVKPLVTISDGVASSAGLTRSTQKGIDQMMGIIKKRIGPEASRVRIAIMHADMPGEAEKLKERIATEFNCVEMWVTYFSPIMGYSTGRGALVVAYQTEST